MLYPEFADRDFHLTGESYGGKFLPLFSYAILEANKAAAPEHHIRLRSTMIGDPFPSPVVQRTHMHVVGEGLNVLDDKNLEQISALEQHCQLEQAVNATEGVTTCNAVQDYVQAVSGQVLQYNAQEFLYDLMPAQNAIVNCLGNSSQREALYAALHVADSTKQPVF